MAQYSVAVLDDYQGLAKTRFSKLDTSKFKVTYFNDTLLPYNHPSTPSSAKDELAQRLEPFHIICTMRERTPFPRELISRLPNLKLLLTTGLRNASLDLAALKERGIPVAGSANTASKAAAPTTPAVGGADSTTEHTVTMMLALARNIAADDASVKSGGWQTSFAAGLSGKTLGLVGLGRLGASTARIMRVAFGMRIVAWSANLTQEAADDKARQSGLPVTDEADGSPTYRVVSRDELFRQADVVSVHLVLSDRSRGLITADDISKMKPTALLVNTSRGPLVVESDLLDALRRGRIAGAALDVFDVEPLPADSEWRSRRWGEGGSSRVLLTPHMGYVQGDNIGQWYDQQVANIERWAGGQELEHVLA